jgi:hypothetical protein
MPLTAFTRPGTGQSSNNWISNLVFDDVGTAVPARKDDDLSLT